MKLFLSLHLSNPKDFRISLPTFTSSTGFPVSETLIVSPIPFASKVPIPTADLIVPLHIGPASVTPKCNG